MRKVKRFFSEYKVELIIGIILAVIFSKLISGNFFYVAIVPSESMEKTLLIGDKLLISKDVKELEPGEVYTFYHDNVLLIKRLIGRGGDRIKIEGNDVFVNGKKLEEPYVSSKMTKEVHVDLIVPADEYYFLGDNRDNSNDARFWSNPFVKRENIDGRAIKLLSFNRSIDKK